MRYTRRTNTPTIISEKIKPHLQEKLLQEISTPTPALGFLGGRGKSRTPSESRNFRSRQLPPSMPHTHPVASVSAFRAHLYRRSTRHYISSHKIPTYIFPHRRRYHIPSHLPAPVVSQKHSHSHWYPARFPRVCVHGLPRSSLLAGKREWGAR